jgi:hypothetical protein
MSKLIYAVAVAAILMPAACFADPIVLRCDGEFIKGERDNDYFNTRRHTSFDIENRRVIIDFDNQIVDDKIALFSTGGPVRNAIITEDAVSAERIRGKEIYRVRISRADGSYSAYQRSVSGLGAVADVKYSATCHKTDEVAYPPPRTTKEFLLNPRPAVTGHQPGGLNEKLRIGCAVLYPGIEPELCSESVSSG